MKKLVVALLLIVVLAGVVFFFGWIQFQLSPAGYGVLFSKTHGWESEVVRPGAFLWRWQRLLPTNVTLYLFELDPQSSRLNLQGELPSAAVYSTVLDSPSPFSYVVQMEIVFSLRPESLPALARDRGVRPDTLGDYYNEISTGMRERAAQAVMRMIESTPDAIGGSMALTEIQNSISATLTAAFPDADIVTVNPTRISLPDLALYTRARELYTTVVETRALAMTEAARATAQAISETERDLALLERYGEILTRYPVLLEYFRLGRDLNTDPLNLESLIPRPGA